MKDMLLKKIENRTMKIAVVGMGYVGLPIARLLLKTHYPVIGLEIDKEKINKLKALDSYVLDVSNDDLKEMFDEGFFITNDYKVIKDCDCVIICVPTPLDKAKHPDLNSIKTCCLSLSENLHKDMLLVVESTVYPGCTKNFIKPLLEKSDYIVGEDFLLSFSPERVCPGEKMYTINNTNKIVSGINEESVEVTTQFYNTFIDANVVKAESLESAELAKLLENAYRFINISFINEIALLCEKLNIDIHHIIDLAKTKPIGFSPFYPNIGIGGHCIPIDPLYLTWIAEQHGVELSLISKSEDVLKNFFKNVVDRICSYITHKPLNEAQVLIVGVAYKENINDLRESPSIKLIENLLSKNISCFYYDDYISNVFINDVSVSKIVDIENGNLCTYDLIILINDQPSLNKNYLIKNSKLIFDVRNILKCKGENIINL